MNFVLGVGLRRISQGLLSWLKMIKIARAYNTSEAYF